MDSRHPYAAYFELAKRLAENELIKADDGSYIKKISNDRIYRINLNPEKSEFQIIDQKIMFHSMILMGGPHASHAYHTTPLLKNEKDTFQGEILALESSIKPSLKT